MCTIWVKQRVAIARALMRKPKGTRCRVRGPHDHHDRAPVTNSDLIIVVHHGRVVEQGTYRELIARKDEFFALVQTQMQAKAK
ncbi:hypothetical protein AMAG_18909 [Allomyces macrogynus ATCC 38327]|uniref:ABC transmembrane type-1 domain-containing protein n=1 Tax=Allomyces macrogynus (strain ATCC 38327) TaxID=578462 RepID=A0A0L0SJV4_ALLM3|nr:hypothetical protein AMAG_18909 [Allomyces macrogynus ATCC 38327]|eukprot:KNE62757.1 hypothetical protein AMAG_18909 [Allomyces macrogynus ATCC 38327]